MARPMIGAGTPLPQITDHSERNADPLVPSGTSGLSYPTKSPVSPASARTDKGRRRLLITLAAFFPVALGGWLLLARDNRGTSRSLRNSAANSAVETGRTARLERREFIRSLRLHGVVEAVQSSTVAAPRLAAQNLNALVITRLVPAGTVVKKGDWLVEFDRQAQIKAAFDREAEYRDFLQQIKKKQADGAAARARDETQLRQAENLVETASLEMKKNEILARIDAQKNQLNLEEGRARLKQLRETFDLKRRAAEAEIRILEIQRDRARNAMRHARANAEKMAIHAALDGIVVLNSIWKGGQMAEVQEGDEVRAGVPFLQVVNPAIMLVRVRVNQADVSELHGGQAIQVHLDAYPNLVFPGKLDRLAAIGVTSGLSQKVRTFVATFSIVGNDPKLMPDLSAAVDVELERRPGALVAPRDALFTENGQTYLLLERGGQTEKRLVKTGSLSDQEVVIEAGVEEGAVVLRAGGSSARPSSPSSVRAQL